MGFFQPPQTYPSEKNGPFSSAIGPFYQSQRTCRPLVLSCGHNHHDTNDCLQSFFRVQEGYDFQFLTVRDHVQMLALSTILFAF